MFTRTAATAAVFCVAMAPAAAFMTAPLPAGARLAAARPARVGLSRPMSVRVHATAAAMPALADYGDVTNVQLSTLQGKALIDKDFPNKKQVFDALPKNTWDRDDKISLMYAAISVALTVGTGALAAVFLPLKLAFLPLWMAYWWAAGTIATGCWVVAHECGHGAFSDNKQLQDAVGYVLHTALMVPYFSWQRSHAVHHSKTNHLTEGETHVPYTLESGKKTLAKKQFMQNVLGDTVGNAVYTFQRMVSHLVFGWPAYLLAGVTGGPVRGMTNHFFPLPPFSTGQKNTELFPGQWKKKVWLSDVGIVAMMGVLAAWSATYGFTHMAALYLGPLAITNCWLVLYTWLQHTDVDVPHYEGENWSFLKGAFMSIDRPYGPIFDFLHHRIGSTHVVHHIDCTIPHYRAKAATEAVAAAFPDHYLYEGTPIPQATWRVAQGCIAVEQRGKRWVFVQGKGTPTLPVSA
mmetsp:Transcript_61883/g.147371  ORF Transcript_61883/g.147371 Transcript_61883/m.147371 type:complete len:462 (-) Transcript_61883:283-1668(-)|eukprot:CAMPEP_0180141224 /NCGR_PEP_ID=MMETSP0986-20121125/14751_1 /TAXON_ID=697907 /ORGANISM="non described non described, Strain CCMP2293" /LENGTH=461 /DNA_ID=CAMNT_0022083977 /DNA_START=122 /DNA_END=1507 /DNA_ORIENTATION=+